MMATFLKQVKKWVARYPADAIIVALDELAAAMKDVASSRGVGVGRFAMPREIAGHLHMQPGIRKLIGRLEDQRHAAVSAPGSITTAMASNFIHKVEALMTVL